MALTLSIGSGGNPFGIDLPSAYVRIRDFEVNARKQVSMTIDTFASEMAYRNGSVPVKSQRMVMEGFDHFAEVSPKEQIYSWMKSSGPFGGAIDAQSPEESNPITPPPPPDPIPEG